MNFFERDFLRKHVRSIVEFYDPVVIDSEGGYFQNFLDDGTVFDPLARHLVSSTRLVFNFCKAHELFAEQRYLDAARHGLRFVERCHWDAERDGYHWTLVNRCAADDQTNHCYGLAFVILCYAAAHQAGIENALEPMQRAFDLLETRFWDEANGLYADEASPDWTHVAPYRGQNANMHCCEALLAAFEATGEERFLARATQVAHRITVSLADLSDGLVWEHFTPRLQVDWDYNRADPQNLYRPWGFQPGHQTEWTKLLLMLHGHRPQAWMLTRAVALFERALSICWDQENGGIFYGFAPDGTICDRDKYFWVQAESMAASARLYAVTKDPKYLRWYERIWTYCWAHMIDHQHGAWFRVLTDKNAPYSNQKSAAGAKCDYHTIGACCDVLRVMDEHDLR